MKLRKPSYNDGVYYFIIGSKDEKGYYIRKLTIDVNNEELIYSQKEHNYSVAFGGDEKYVKIYEQIPKYNDVIAEEYQNTIREQIEHIIGIFDLDYKYNSVGSPVQTYIFR